MYFSLRRRVEIPWEAALRVDLFRWLPPPKSALLLAPQDNTNLHRAHVSATRSDAAFTSNHPERA